MTKLEKLQKEYPMFELTVRPTPKFIREAYEEAGYEAPERLLYFCYKGSFGDYVDYVGGYDWSISSLRNNLDDWVSKI